MTAAALALALPAAALAKGPTEAAIDGPGLKAPIVLTGNGDDGYGSAFGSFVEDTGFFPAVFARTPDPMLTARPAGDLGPAYTVTWKVPGPAGVDTIVSDLYPYASGSPAMYTKPGQPFFGSEQTHGGWYVAPPSLKTTLVTAGLPEQAPGAGGDSFWSTPVIATLAAAGSVLLALAVIGALLRRRAEEVVALS
jgi:hypothetical protein